MSELEEDFAPSDANNYLSLIALTILYYDYLLTLHAEQERFWKHSSFTWAAICFYFNRYFSLLGHIPVALEYFWTTQSPGKVEICHKLQSFHQYSEVIIQIVVAAMLTIRTYALFERAKWILCLLGGIAVTGIAVGAWALLHGNDAPDLKLNDTLYSIGCATYVSKSSGIQLALAWSGALVFDLLVFWLTLYKALTMRRAGGGLVLLDVLIRDGTIYFATMFATNLANIVTMVVGDASIRATGTTLTNVIASVSISRLMLNLRDPSLSPAARRNQTTINPTTFTPDLTNVTDYSNDTDETRVLDTGRTDLEMTLIDYRHSNKPK